MATYTEAQAITQFKNGVKPFEVIRQACESNSPNWLGLEDTFTQSLHSDYANEITAGMGTARSFLNSLLAACQSVVSPVLRTWAQVLVSPDLAPDASDQVIVDRIYDHMANTSGDRLQSRAITYGTPALAGGSVGNGSIFRLTKDDHNFDLEAIYLEQKIAKCVLDQNLGQNKHQELFEFRGAKANKDLLSLKGSGGATRIVVRAAPDSLLTNPSFDQYDNAATPTTITNWTPTTNISNFAIDTANYYRGYNNDDATTHQSLKIKANDSVTQTRTNFRAQIPLGTPLYCQLAFNRAINGCNDGTLTFQVGTRSVTVVLSAQAGWQVLSFPLTTNAWYRQMAQNNFGVVVGLSGSTTFNLLVDDVLVLPMDYFDGTWYSIVGGLTPFMRDDYFTWSDTAIDSILQRWMWRMFPTPRYFPAAYPAPAVGTLTVAQSATAGVVTAGSHVVAVSVVDVNGTESAPSAISGAYTAADSLHKADVTNIPLGPTNTASRWVYMSKAGTTTPLYRAVQINDNTTTSLTGANGVNVADGSLVTVSVAGGITIADP